MDNGGRNFCKMPHTLNRSVWRKPRNERLKRGLNCKVHLAVDAHGMLIRAIVTDGTTPDCTQLTKLIENLKGDYLIVDKGYDGDEIVRYAQKQGFVSVIPPRKPRNNPRNYDKHLYKMRHTVENTFLKMKRWRGIAHRFCKNASSFRACIHIYFIMLWSKLF